MTNEEALKCLDNIEHIDQEFRELVHEALEKRIPKKPKLANNIYKQKSVV